MKFWMFHLMPWPHLPQDFEEKYDTAWVTCPNSLFDTQRGPDVYHQYINQLVYADQLGFDGVVINEHHQNAYGIMPSPNLIAAALSQRIQRARVMVLGNGLPLYEVPIKIAEEFAMLDNMFRGKFDAGFVVGGGPEYYSYNINPLGISVPHARIGNFFYTVTPKAEGGQQEVRELLFHDQHSELAMGAIPDQMSPEMTMLFYKAQMVAARLGWKPPYLHNPRLKDRLFRIPTPTLLVWAEDDRLAPVGLAKVFTQGLAHAEVARVPGAGHSLLLEQPQRTAELVSQFLQR